jgi:hypothetical protein
MVQTTLDFSRPVKLPANPFNAGTQCHDLYEWLSSHGKITLNEIHNVLHQDTARIRTDIKTFLRSQGFDIECKKVGESNTEYRVV